MGYIYKRIIVIISNLKIENINKNLFKMSNNIIVNESGTAANIENYKIVILGDQHVGKTSILSKYKYETVEEGYAVIYLY